MLVRMIKYLVFLIVAIISALIPFYLTSQYVAFSLAKDSKTPTLGKVETKVSEPSQIKQEDEALVPKFTDFQTFLEPFIYDPKNRKDPFKPYVEAGPTPLSEFQGPLLPLQRFDLNEIKLVGVIWNVPSPKAMFLDPTHMVHTIGKNERIGRNNGYIAMIREGEVVVVEATHKNEEVIYTTTVMKITR